MVFSSHIFLFYFLPTCLVLYFIAPRPARNLVLTALSYIFYGWSNPSFMGLMLLSTMIDYVCGRILTAGTAPGNMPRSLMPGGPRKRAQKWAVGVSVVTNLALLGFFKYFNFTIESYNALAATMGYTGAQLDSVLRVTLPLGISFYTFQSMSYTIDVYRGKAPSIRNPLDFACYVAMFPQLVAGPIVRFADVADQLLSRRHTLQKFARGIAFFCVGMAKKILLANPCGRIADTVFDAGSSSAIDAWYGAAAYASQIYFDFSGYSDMAIGLGLIFGFSFPKNFDSPYRARSVTDFWRRWHMSLSGWFRDYLYLPLGGSRRGTTRTYINLALVMLLGGLWHGASWNFVIWGGLHGGALAWERARGKRSLYNQLPGPLQVLFTWSFVLIAWVFFRAESLTAALEYLIRMVGLGTPHNSAGLLAGSLYAPYPLFSLGLALCVIWLAPQTWDWTRQLTWGKMFVTFGAFWMAIVALFTQSYNPFIYFIF